MHALAVDSAFDVAEWFLETALNDKEALQPMKTQFLMFLAQGYYAAASKGKRLIPCIFIATSRGPVEPCTYKIYAQMRPEIIRSPISDEISGFLNKIWRRFGAYSGSALGKMLLEHPPVSQALALGENVEIDLKSMTDFYTSLSANNVKQGNDAFNRPRILRSHTGRAVCVKKWEPAKKQSS